MGGKLVEKASYCAHVGLPRKEKKRVSREVYEGGKKGGVC